MAEEERITIEIPHSVDRRLRLQAALTRIPLKRLAADALSKGLMSLDELAGQLKESGATT